MLETNGRVAAGIHLVTFKCPFLNYELPTHED